MVVAPHPDDETLGAGGTILKYKDQGDEVFWLILTNISTALGYTANQVRARQAEIEKVGRLFGFREIIKLDFPAAALDQIGVSEIIKQINPVVSEIAPETIILPYRHDIHSDHCIGFDAAYSCTKIFRHSFIKKILMMEVLSETDFAIPEVTFSPNYFVDIGPYLEKKIEILKNYESELGPHPFPRSVKSVSALAAVRGTQAGCDYAESFMLLKSVN
jgi:LmbE family N-acetylglucosaminyl deacetylase